MTSYDDPEAGPAGDDSQERRPVGGPAVTAANAALLSLSRAARSFTLYDPTNKVVRQLIADYREKFAHALAAHGALSFDVHPFELLLGGDVVYVEKDRERSLAFRLFRDGVRHLRFVPEVSWDELLRLLEILSIRFTGVRQQEDDLVTLLRKAGFTGIVVGAIEGFVPEEELAEAPMERRARGAAFTFDPPRQWDVPLPEFAEAGALRHRPIALGVLEALRTEEGPETLAEHALAAARELLKAARTPAEREAAQVFAGEVREFLVVEGASDALGELATVEADAGFVDPSALRAVVLGLPPDTADAPPALAAMIEAAPDEVFAVVQELFGAEGDGPRAPLLRRLLARAARGSIPALTEGVRSGDAPVAAALLTALGEVDAKAALAAGLERARAGEGPVQAALADLLEAAPADPAVLPAIRGLLSANTEAIRVRGIALLARRLGPRSEPLLRVHLEAHLGRAGEAEAEAVGRAMAEGAPRAALEAFTAWLHTRSGGLLGRLAGMGAPLAEQRAALAGLERIGGEEAEGLLALLAEKGDVAVRPRAAESLAARGAARAPRVRHG